VPGVKVAESNEVRSGGVESGGVNSSTPPLPHSPTHLRILVADDTKMNQMVLKAMFRRLGVTDVTCADNGREALEALTAPDAPKFDFVLTDMWMPEMDGVRLVESIRSNPSVAKTKVYLFTAEVEMKDTYAADGFDGILLKPITGERLSRILAGS
jgi:two-component system chemotaxis response regulator CheY